MTPFSGNIIITFVNKILKMVTIIKKGASREKILIALNKRKAKVKSPDLKKYCGSIMLTEDALNLQKKWRDEWE